MRQCFCSSEIEPYVYNTIKNYKYENLTSYSQYGTSKANTPFYDNDGFQEAASKEEVCTVKRNILWPIVLLEREEKKEKVSVDF